MPDGGVELSLDPDTRDADLSGRNQESPSDEERGPLASSVLTPEKQCEPRGLPLLPSRHLPPACARSRASLPMMGLLGPCFSGIDSPRLAGPHSSQPSTHSRQPRLAIAPAPAPAPQAAAQKGSARRRAHGGRAGGAAPRPGRCSGPEGAHSRRAARAYGKCSPGARVRRPRGGGGRLRERARRRPIALRATRNPRPREWQAPGGRR